MDYSPEQIAGRLKLKGKPTVSHERIYQHVWADKKQGGELYKHLRRKGRKYRKRGLAKDMRGIIKDRIGIEQRPEIVDKKEYQEVMRLISKWERKHFSKIETKG